MSKNMEEKKRVGRPLKVTPEELWEKTVEYLEWCETEKITREVPMKGGIVLVSYPRPPLWEGLMLRLKVSRDYLAVLEIEAKKKAESEDEEKRKEGEEYLSVIARVKNIMFEKKYTGAAIGLWDARLVTRYLGIAEKKEIKHEGSDFVAKIVYETPGEEDKS